MLLNEQLKGYKLILGSQSPRRKQLLADMGLVFEVIVRDVDESFDDTMLQHDVALTIAEKKAKAFDDIVGENTLVITADTIVCLENKIIGKPKNANEAFEILQQLSGNRHTVITGVCLRSSKKQKSFFVTTDVYFKPLDADEMYYYIANYQPFDKAGAYGIQEWIGLIGLEKMNGSYHNVMGLPTSELYKQLLQFIA